MTLRYIDSSRDVRPSRFQLIVTDHVPGQFDDAEENKNDQNDNKISSNGEILSHFYYQSCNVNMFSNNYIKPNDILPITVLSE